MRPSGPETGPGLVTCCRLKCALVCRPQPADRCLPVSERSRLKKMVSDLPGALIDGTGIDQLDRVDDAGVQPLPAWGRDACKQGLTHKLMGEGERLVGSLGAGDDYSHLLRLLDDGEKLVNVDLAGRSKQFKAETAPDNRGGRKH